MSRYNYSPQEIARANKERRAEWASRWRRPIYFVYLLLDGDRPFYVGQSCRNDRLGQHVRHARAGKGSAVKNAIIRGILDRGQKLDWRKVAEGLTLPEALEFEAGMILKSPELSLTQNSLAWRKWAGMT